MERRRVWAAGILLVALVAGWFWWRSDNRRIHRRLDRLEELMSKDGPEEQIAAFGIAREVASYFTSEFVVRAQPWEGTLTSERDLVGALHRYRSAALEIEARVRERELEIDSQLGLATLLGVADVAMDFRGRKGREVREVRVEWVKDDGRWKIREVELLEPVGESLFR